ncbi:hypothetical protein B0H10DRAFT_1961124 [Mycena sp. CBHHK59/15]|nr:hypothetical protein B0H10DRAFT_1961124 [Mycena sp. CBHHK59/15]
MGKKSKRKICHSISWILKKNHDDAKNTKPAANQKKNKLSKNFSGSEEEDSEDDGWSGSENAKKSGSESDDEPVQKKTKLQQKAKSNPPKSKVRDTEDEDVEPPPKKARISASVPSPPPTRPITSKPSTADAQLRRSKLLSTCPNPACNDRFPVGKLDLGADLEKLLAKCVQLLSTPNHDAEKLKKVNKSICAHLQQELEIRRLEQLADTNGWPVLIDFNDIVDRMLTLKDKLADLILSDYDLHNCVTWENFLESIDYKIHTFGALREPNSLAAPFSGTNLWLCLGHSHLFCTTQRSGKSIGRV